MSGRRPWFAATIVGLGAVCAAAPVHAESCSIVGTVGVGFGAYDVFSSSPLDSAGSITYRCTGVVETDTVTISISAGNSGSFAQRQMLDGAETLDYNLFREASRSTVFGDGTSGTSIYGPVTPPENEDVTVNVYGRAPALQDVSVGSYSDTVIVTLTF